MTARRILLIQAHPDRDRRHLGHALENAYAAGAAEQGHLVRRIQLAALDFPLLRSLQDWEQGQVPAALAPAQQDLLWAEHVVLFFPLWLGGMPALLKGFLEQVMRPGFAFGAGPRTLFTPKGLAGRSARLVVTMGMPAPAYRWWYRAHALRALERNILGFVGIAPVRETLVGEAAQIDAAAADGWQARLAALGRKGA